MIQEKKQPYASDGTVKRKTGGELLAQAALSYIETHYQEKFSLQAMAGKLYVNGSYLLREFKKYTGFTPLAYHNHVRCEKAKEQLINTDECVSDIGEAVGFVSPAHFSHVFKRKAVRLLNTDLRITSARKTRERRYKKPPCTVAAMKKKV